MPNRSQRHLREVQGYDSNDRPYYIPGPVWDGTDVTDQADTTAGPITPLDISGEFSTTSGQAMEFDAGALPTGLVIDSATGIISGTPTATGTFVVRASAKDGFGVAYSNRFDWVIT
jgi:hypothetical protein